MRVAAAIIGLSAMVAGCAGTDAQLRSLERDNALRIEPVSGKPYDYVVRLGAYIDFGYDPRDKATRDDVALRSMRAQCPAARIVGEDTIEKVGGGQEFLIRVKCAPDAPSVADPAPKRRKPGQPT